MNKKEIKEAFKKFEINNVSQEDIEDIIRRIDRNDNGTIDYSEFVIATINKKKLLDKKNLEATFKMIDKDGSNFITADELKEFFMGDSKERQLDEKVWGLIIKEVDQGDDHQISYEKFKEIMFKLL